MPVWNPSYVEGWGKRTAVWGNSVLYINFNLSLGYTVRPWVRKKYIYLINPGHQRCIFIVFCSSSWIAWQMDAGSSNVRQQDVNRGVSLSCEFLCIILREKIDIQKYFYDAETKSAVGFPFFFSYFRCKTWLAFILKSMESHILPPAPCRKQLVTYSDSLEGLRVIHFFTKQTRNHFWTGKIRECNFDGDIWRTLFTKL